VAPPAPVEEVERRQTRPFVTPEGVDLELVLASASERASAFLLDIAIICGILFIVTLVVIAASILLGFAASEYMFVIWILTAFFLRNFYFMAFELSPRASTPGKRALGVRVVMRNGGPLTADAVFARNAMRELEVFLPLSFLVSQATAVDAAVAVLALIWCCVFVFFPLFNRDRLRVGDLAAGTWVVHAPKRMLEPDIASEKPAGGIMFSREAVDAYGIKELSVLEDVLRRRDPATMAAVAQRIRAKINVADGKSDAEFLSAYYSALRSRLESRLLLGQRKRDKHDR